jgi:hypothetical protein
MSICENTTQLFKKMPKLELEYLTSSILIFYPYNLSTREYGYGVTSVSPSNLTSLPGKVTDIDSCFPQLEGHVRAFQ